MDGFHGIHPSLLLLLGPVRGVQYRFGSFLYHHFSVILTSKALCRLQTTAVNYKNLSLIIKTNLFLKILVDITVS